LLNTSSDNSTVRTRAVSKAVCAAVIGGAAMLVQ
jgi:hypothetical protein